VIAGITEAEVETDGGVVAVQAACQPEFGALARICATVEAMNSPGLTTTTTTPIWRLREPSGRPRRL